MKSFSLSAREFDTFKHFIEKEVGIELQDDRNGHLLNRIIKHLRELNISNIEMYQERLKYDDKERINFINLITNVSTNFFRESHHFDYLASILPSLIATNKRIRIWSAGCSTGEEAYSIAITLYRAYPSLKNIDIKILATDVNTNALEVAKKGIYEANHIITTKELSNWFHEIKQNNHEYLKVDDKLKEIITFKKLNLLDPWPMKGPFDIIFCRNVTIYFTKEVTEHIFERFDKLLSIDGILILGHSEKLNFANERYISLGKTMYQKGDHHD